MSGAALSRPVELARPEALVWAYGCSPVQRARLTDATRGRARLRVLESAAELTACLRLPEAPDVIVVSVVEAEAREAAALLRLIAASCPRAALVGYVDGDPAMLPGIASLAAAGVHQLLFTGMNDTGAQCRAVLQEARRQCAAAVVLAALRSVFPDALHPVAEAALARPAAVTDVRALADALGVHRKTLFNRCARACSLPPAGVLGFTRLALVAYLLESTTHTVESIALELGYPSPTALRNGIRRYTGLRATDIRAGGGLSLVLGALRTRLEATAPPQPLHLV